MSRLADSLPDYLALRNRLGHKLADAARLLPRFVAWMDTGDQETITIAAALEWCQGPQAGPDSHIWSHRMTAVRGFARYMSGIDPATEVPPIGLLPTHSRWRLPYIYSAHDVATLLCGAGRLRSPLRAATYQTFFGLLACTGMRVGEAIRLRRDDVDLDAGVITVRESKFGKSGLLPTQDSTTTALQAYADQRSQYRPGRETETFFVSLTRRPLIYVSVHEVFGQLRTEGKIGAGSPHPVTIHGLRHSFAVNTLIGWYREDLDVAARLPLLSTYLGHHDPRSTYWYLSASPELLAIVADRLEPMIGKVLPR